MSKNNTFNLKDIIGKKIIFTSSINHPYSLSEGTIKKFSTNNKCIKIGDSWFIFDDIKILDFNEEDATCSSINESIGFKLR
jgi:hypothetical protein